MSLLGIDISNHQGKANIDLDAVLRKNPKIKFVILKASEGIHFTDAYLKKFADTALEHNCLLMIYHYARAARNSASAEADYFYKLFKPYIGKAIPALDWEERDAASKSPWAKEWCAKIEKLTGSTVVFYSYESMINANNYSNLTKFPLWVAKYKDRVADYNFDMSNAGPRPVVKWWSSYIMWQWTSCGRLNGYSENLDCNIFYGTASDWKKMIGGKALVVSSDVPKYVFKTTNPVQIANSGSDENGNYRGGKAGDQTGREWQIRNWYNRPWNCVIRHPDPNVRAYIAMLAVKAANNDEIGYDQSQRNTFWEELQKVNYDPSKITTACESDCSAGVIAITKATGYLLNMQKLKNIGATYTGNMRSAYLSAGFTVLTASKYTAEDDYLVAGDILLNDVHHVAIAVTNGVRSGADTSSVKREDYEMMPLIKKGSKGMAVKWLQQYLGGLTIDGEFGEKTDAKVRAFQKKNGLTVDGEVGPNTWAKIISTL